MAQVAVLITYREVFGKEPSLDDLHVMLKKYKRVEVLGLLAKLNCLLGTWQNQPEFQLDSKLSALVLPTYNRAIQAIRRSSGGRILFSRLTILYLVKQACMACPSQGNPVNKQTAIEEIGVCCLMANDLALTNMPSPMDGALERLSSLLPFSDYVPHDEYLIDIARALLMFGEVTKLPTLTKRGDFLDLEALFQHYMGLPPRDFCVLVFGAATKYFNLKPENLEASPEALLLRPQYFQKTNIDQQLVSQFFTRVAASEEKFARQVSDARDRPGDDLTIIQRYPLVEVIEGLHLCLDPGFLVDKAGRGLYWSLFFEIKDNRERLNLASFWGAVFEEYVNSIVESSYSAGGQFIPAPKFANGDQAFDACLVEDGALVVFEHKSSVLRADAKYSGDIRKLEEQLRSKFIRGDDDGAKGLAQLERSIRRFLDGEKVGDLGKGGIHTIYPVLVCLDRTLLSFYMNKYLNQWFPGHELRKKYKKAVTPVFTVGISELERLLPYLHEISFSGVLESYYRTNPTMLSSLSSSDVPILKNAKRGKDLLGEKFSKFTDEMLTMFFGEDQGAAPNEGEAIH